MESVENHEVDLIVVARLDRLGRSLAHVLRLLDLSTKHGGAARVIVGHDAAFSLGLL